MNNNGLKLERYTHIYYSIAIVLLLAIVVFVRIRLLNVPLERDEGEFAYLGQLLLSGIPPYLTSYSMKPPGIFGAYALSMFFFGENQTGIHIGLLIVNLGSIIFLFYLSKRLYDFWTALTASASYVLLTLSQTVYGVFAHATHYVIFFVLAGLLMLVDALEKDSLKRYLFSGILLGFSCAMKQQAFFLMIFTICYFLLQSAKSHPFILRRLFEKGLVFFLGILIPIGSICLLLALSGTLQKFWFWTYSYPSELVSQMTLRRGIDQFLGTFMMILVSFAPLLCLAACGAVILCSDRFARRHICFVAGLFLFSFAAISPGFHYSPHYFVLMMPVLAILIGICVSFIVRHLSQHYLKIIPLLVFLLASGYTLYQERNYLFIETPIEVVNNIYVNNPFVESLVIAEYIKEHSSADDRIAILGSEPQIYFYTGLQAVTSFNQVYALMENQPYAERMQKQMIHEIEEARPKYVVFVKVDASWMVLKSSNMSVIKWGVNYVKNLYDQVGVVDIIDSDTTHCVWDNKAAEYTPISNSFITVFKRKKL